MSAKAGSAAEAVAAGEHPVLFEPAVEGMPQWPLTEGPPVERRGSRGGSSGPPRAISYYHIARVYEQPSHRAAVRALVRTGTILPVTEKVRGPGCPRGQWFAVAPEGYVCSSKGFGVFDWDKPYGHVSDAPDTSHGLPYHYGKLVDQGALVLDRVPTRAEWKQLRGLRARRDAGASWRKAPYPKLVREQVNGAYFFALGSREQTGSGRWLHTIRGRVISAAAVELLPATRMRGEPLKGGRPVAFVVEDETPVRSAADLSDVVGVARRYGRFVVDGEVERDGRRYLRAHGGGLVDRAAVRRVRVTRRPSGVGAGERWVHVDLPEQVLVAYEGDRAVFATLIASGIEGHGTPPGLYRVREKHVTATMSGPDPDMGVYDVEEVPWTQYFSGDFALHGAYWHDGFGAVRSHGCVNLPPEDARWLFLWTAPELPGTWHSMRQAAGTWVYVTDR